jgi:hypothetical protein
MNLACCKTMIVSRPASRSAASLLGLAFIAIVTMGCAEAKPARAPVFPAKGTLTLKNQPAHGAIISFHPKTPLPAGVPSPKANVGKDGSFSITTYDSGDGAPEGEYVATIIWNKLIQNGGESKIGPNVIPPKYGRPDTSDLEIKIVSGNNSLPPIQL